jgi:hypothetical protein
MLAAKGQYDGLRQYQYLAPFSVTLLLRLCMRIPYAKKGVLD